MMAATAPENHGLRLAVRYAVLILIAVIFIFPLIFMLMSSLKPDQQLLTDTESLRAFLPVGDISLDNYFAAFRRAPVGLFVFNSVLVTGLTVLLSLVVCSLAAFAFVFIDWRGRELVLTAARNMSALKTHPWFEVRAEPVVPIARIDNHEPGSPEDRAARGRLGLDEAETPA